MPGRGIDHPPPPSPEVKEIVELYLYSPSGPSWPVLGRTLHFFIFTPNLLTQLLNVVFTNTFTTIL
jgi:hypothetical protein